MALTNFAALTSNQLTVWSREFWSEARNHSFIMGFAGNGPNNMVQRITELKNTTDGARAVITLVNDAIGDGIVGDNTLEGNEEALRSSDQVIQLDQLRHAHRSEGTMAEQRSVVKFRGEAKDKLAYWIADRMDQIGFLTLSGLSYSNNTDGSLRIGSQLPLLKFNADVTPPSAARGFRWVAATNSIAPAATGSVLATDLPSWKMLVQMKAQATNAYLRPIRTSDGVDMFYVFMSPNGIARLKQDTDFITSWRYARERGGSNPIFKGTPTGGREGIMIDGMHILEYRHVYTTLGLASGTKWGAGGLVDGQRILFCGSQALAFADIGGAMWHEKEFDFANSPGIAVGKKFGLLKPKFYSIYSKSTEDHGVMTLDTAI